MENSFKIETLLCGNMNLTKIINEYLNSYLSLKYMKELEKHELRSGRSSYYKISKVSKKCKNCMIPVIRNYNSRYHCFNCGSIMCSSCVFYYKDDSKWKCPNCKQKYSTSSVGVDCY